MGLGVKMRYYSSHLIPLEMNFIVDNGGVHISVPLIQPQQVRS
jgi:hypothetical protein